MFSLLLPKTFANKYPVKIVLKLKGLLAFLALYVALLYGLWIFHQSYAQKYLLRNLLTKALVKKKFLWWLTLVANRVALTNRKGNDKQYLWFWWQKCGRYCYHRKDIVALPIDAEFDDIISLVKDLKYSRIPVYEEDIDNIIGILHIKDFMRYIILYGKDKFNLKNF